MVQTTKEEQFLQIFKNCIKIEAKTISVKTLLSERNLRRINYSPYYQRNYVWDNAKQTFFIESVILGTEIPPLIFFKSGMTIEVIDGRQRFETLKKFKENDIRLTSKGLMSLEFLAKHTFNTLTPENLRDAFWNSNIRIFEFEVVNVPNLNPEIEDKIKKEIFRRYNTGITPLTSSEVDNAKYNEDRLSDLFKHELKGSSSFAKKVIECFYTPSSPRPDIDELSNYLRRLFILNKFPISKYASGKERIETFDLLYDFATQNIEDYDEEFSILRNQINVVHDIYTFFVSDDSKLRNKLIYECIMWAIRVIENEGVKVDLNIEVLKQHYQQNISVYAAEESHYYGNVMKRFIDTSKVFNDSCGFDFSSYLRNPTFKQYVKANILEAKGSAIKIEQFENLRINKPSPISTPIDEIKLDVRTSRYLVRPSYQRQEKISEYKASSIIESILLGINLPPIFIYNKKDGTKEVIDGQQRLLSIIGFLGEEYNNEFGRLTFSKNNNFKLRGLKILSELNGRSHSQISEEDRDKILDFTIDVIMIEENINENFEPTDLFIRLNNKPYPIQQNSFEMWNSTVDAEVIREIKQVTKEHASWFYIKETSSNNEERSDRMENEELITILSFIKFNSMREPFDKIILFFNKQDRINCRINNKAGLSDFLQRLEKEASEKELFIKCIRNTDVLIRKLGSLLRAHDDKEVLNDFLNVRNNKTFRRSLQDFYIIWIVLVSYTDAQIMSSNSDADIHTAISEMIAKFRNKNNEVVDDSFIPSFVEKLKSLYTP